MEYNQDEDIEMIYSEIEKELFADDDEKEELDDDELEPSEEAFMRGYEEDSG